MVRLTLNPKPMNQVGDPKAILSRFLVILDTAELESTLCASFAFLVTPRSGVSGGVSGRLKPVDRFGLGCVLPAPCGLLVRDTGAVFLLLNAIWMRSSCRGTQQGWSTDTHDKIMWAVDCYVKGLG